MSRTETALEVFARTKRAIDEHIAANKPVFDAHQTLVMANIDARNALEDVAAEEKENVSAGGFTVTVTPQTQTIVDPDDLKANEGKVLTPELIKVLMKVHERPPRISVREV